LSEYTGFLVVLASGLFFSELFKRLHVPYVVALIVAGIAIGPLGLGIVELTPPILFLGSIGAVFLMFMAGMEVRTGAVSKFRKKLVVLVLMNGAVPGLVGFVVTLIFGYEPITAVIIGTVFVSSSVAVIIPTLEAKSLISTDVGAVIIGATILEDLGSLFFLSMVLQTTDPTTFLPLPIFIGIVAVSVFVLKYFLPRIEEWFFKNRDREKFEQEFQFVLITTIAVAVYFEFLGMHAIVAGFLVGLILSGTIKHHRIESKLHAISYGVFIPIFFLEIGIETDLTVFFSINDALYLTVAIVGGLIASKLLSGYVAGRLIGFPKYTSLLIGGASIPQLSTSLAVAFTASELGLLDARLQASIVILSMVTVLLAPFIIELLTRNFK